jgi:2-hydroxy-6-oxonona-2,4-dienedioate hydrolase
MSDPGIERNGIAALQAREIVVDGLRMFFRASLNEVPAERPPVVLVHGLVVASDYMLPTAERLAVASMRLTSPVSAEAPTRAFDIIELADALAAWIRALGLGRAVLLGNSFGCQVVAECAVRHPDVIERLVLQGPTIDPGARTLRRQLGCWLQNSLCEPPMSRIMLRDYWRAGIPRAISTLRFLFRDTIEQKLPRIEAPALVVRGARDPMVPQNWAEKAVALLPRGRLVVIPGAAHTVVYFAPRQLTQVVRSFLLDRAPDLRLWT